MRKFFALSASVVACILLAYSCNKPSTIGSDLLPDDDIIDLLFTDSIDLRSSTFLGDSVKTYGPTANEQLDYYLLGQLEDPVFGKSSSEMYIQFGLTTKPELEDPIVEEVILSIAYAADGHSGNLTQPQTLEVYRLEDELSVIDTLYSNQTFNVNPVPISDDGMGGTSFSFIPEPNDSVMVDSVNLSPQIRIRLSNDLGQELLDSLASPYFLGLTDEFTNFFNGVNVRPADGNTAMLRMSLSSIYSEITMYYKDSSGMAADRESISFAVRSTSVKSVHFEHDYAGTDIEYYLEGNAPISPYYSYIQSMEGVGTKIEFTGLEDWEDVIVNKAELEITVIDDDALGEFTLPDRLAAFQLNDDGDGLLSVADVGLAINAGSFSLFGGQSESEFENGQKFVRYKMFLTAYLQGVIDDRYNENAIYILPFDRGESTSRMIIGGSGNPTHRMKLNLTYTKL